MNTAHWHLALNHFPVVSTIIGTALLIVGYLFLNKNSAVKNIALGVLAFAALIAIPAYFSGEGAEEIVEKIPGIADNTIERHEDLGKSFFIAIELLGLLAVGSFVAGKAKSKLSSFLYLVTTVVALGVSIFGFQVANSGGKVRHSEINGDIGSAGQVMPANSNGQDRDQATPF